MTDIRSPFVKEIFTNDMQIKNPPRESAKLAVKLNSLPQWGKVAREA